MLRKIEFQNRAFKIISKGLQENKLSHSLLFVGPNSVGKSTLALYIAAYTHCKSDNKPCFNCEDCLRIKAFSHPAVIFINTDNVNNKIETINSVILKNGLNDELFEELIFLVKDVKYRIESEYLNNSGIKNKKKRKEIDKKIDEINLFFNLSLNAQKSDANIQNLIKNVLFLSDQVKNENIPAEKIRELMSRLDKSSFGGDIVLIITDIEKMRTEAANSFLKTLEEPPKGKKIILCTTEPDKILSTIKSRCFKINFKSLNQSEVKKIGKINWNIECDKVSFKGSILERLNFKNTHYVDELVKDVFPNFDLKFFEYVEKIINENNYEAFINDLTQFFEYDNSYNDLWDIKKVTNKDKILLSKKITDLNNFVKMNNANVRFVLEKLLLFLHSIWRKSSNYS